MKTIISFRGQRKIAIQYFFMITIVAMVLGAIVGNIGAQGSDRHPRFEFIDGEKVFCGDEGRIDIGIVTFEDTRTGGFTTPEQAIDDYVTRLHFVASGGLLPDNVTLPEEILTLLEPSRQFTVSERQDVTEDIIYFNLPSSKDSVLEARIVVERFKEGFYISSTYICESQLVSDPVKFEQLWNEEVSKNESQ